MDTKKIYGSLMSTIRAASQLAAQDVGFYRPLNNHLDSSSRHTSRRILDLVNNLNESVCPDQVPPLTNAESIDKNWRNIGAVFDTLFEKTDVAVDTIAREKSNRDGSSSAGGSRSDDVAKSKALAEKLTTIKTGDEPVVRHSSRMAKPQLKFRRPVDNSRDTPFQPLLRSKPFAINSLEDSLVLTDSPEDAAVEDKEKYSEAVGISIKEFKPHYGQPYKTEILNQDYPSLVYENADSIPFKDWESTTAIYVDTEEKLQAMISDLKKASAIAVDLEHHDYRSFHGFVCLMQVSSREQDWIVDTLVLRDELQQLNEVFADPSIVKVFHGAYMDIIWLQRDFGLYVVSLFDTFHAARALGLPKHSLAYLLERYAKFVTSKKYQLSDWRVRPLSSALLSYARADTHFLLYIFDELRNSLIERRKIEAVLDDSRRTACKRYEKPGYAAKEGFNSLVTKYNLRDQQKYVLERLYDWRDRLAREADESTGYVAPNQFLISLATKMPGTVADLLGCSNSDPSVFVRNSANDLVKMIEKAREEFNKRKIEHVEEVEEVVSEVNKEKVVIDEVGDYEEYQRQYALLCKRQAGLFTDEVNIKYFLDCMVTSSSGIYGYTMQEQEERRKKESKKERKRRLEREAEKEKLYKERARLMAGTLSQNPFMIMMQGEIIGEEDVEMDEQELALGPRKAYFDRPTPYSPEPTVAAVTANVSESSSEPSSASKRKHREDEEKEDGAHRLDEGLEAQETKDISVKKRSKKRKLKMVTAETAPDMAASDSAKATTGTRDSEKSKKKGKEKENKSSETRESSSEFNAFDFKSAPSVLKQDFSKLRAGKGSRPKKEFNPYGENDSGPKGLRKAFRKSGSRSATFKTKK